MKTPRSAILLLLVAGLGAVLFWLGRESASQPSTDTLASPASVAPNAARPAATKPAAPASGTPAAAALVHAVDSPSSFEIPAAYALQPGTRVGAADNWTELLAGLSDEQRTIAERFAARYPEAYHFVSAEQLQWMIDRGYPMPEEIIEAELMPMDELLARANSGNVKAMMLAVDRWAREAAAAPESLTDPQRRAEAARMWDLNHRMRESCSPFSAFAGSRLGETLQRDDNGLGTLVNLSFIQARGDWRVDTSIAETARALSLSPDAAAALSMLNSTYTDVLPQRCLATPLPGRY